MPERITLRLYPSPERFARGLVEEAGVSPALAARVAPFAAGVSFDRTVALLEPEAHRGERAWMRLLAHEMTHVAQIELAGGEGRGARWLAEGMADWVAVAVLDGLDIAPMSVERASRLRAARVTLAGMERPLDVAPLGDPRAFVEHGERMGVVPLYRLAFLLVDHLVERHGFGALVTYSRSFAATADGVANFRGAFGESLDEFERAVAAREARGFRAPPVRPSDGLGAGGPPSVPLS